MKTWADWYNFWRNHAFDKDGNYIPGSFAKSPWEVGEMVDPFKSLNEAVSEARKKLEK